MEKNPKKFDIGDKVTAVYTYPMVGDSYIEGTVMHTPQGPGDVYFLENTDGQLLMVNPYHWALSHILRDG